MMKSLAVLGLLLLASRSGAETNGTFICRTFGACSRPDPGTADRERRRIESLLTDCGNGRRCLPGGFVFGSPVELVIVKDRAKYKNRGRLYLESMRVDGTRGWYGRFGGYFPIATYHAPEAGNGPKRADGDGRAPEGFFRIYPDQMNPDSSWYLSFDTDYPYQYRSWEPPSADPLQERRSYSKGTGDLIMVHGYDKSVGCFAMGLDPEGQQQIGEIYTILDEAFKNGQPFVNLTVKP